MTWARVSSGCIAVACALVIIANAPAVLTDPLYTAVAQIRVNAAITQPTAVRIENQESTSLGTSVETSAAKKVK